MVHTPGPWKAVNYHCNGHEKPWPQIENSEGEIIARTYGTHERVDVHLIAAAPDLLEACHKALNILESEKECLGVYKAHKKLIEKAIKKAGGE